MENNLARKLQRSLGVMSFGLATALSPACTIEEGDNIYGYPGGESGAEEFQGPYNCENGVTMTYDLCLGHYSQEKLQDAIGECERGIKNHGNGMTDNFFQCMYDVCLSSENLSEIDKGKNACESSFGNHYM